MEVSLCAVPREVDGHGDVVSTMEQLLMFHGNDQQSDTWGHSGRQLGSILIGGGVPRCGQVVA